jgi:hypothetical protein
MVAAAVAWEDVPRACARARGVGLVTLDREDVEAIARRVVELLGGHEPAVASLGSRLVDAAAVAAAMGVSRDYVYRHAGELGGRRVGEGERPRLRFALEEAVARAASGQAGRAQESVGGRVAAPVRRRRRGAAAGSGARLLPIRGSGG